MARYGIVSLEKSQAFIETFSKEAKEANWNLDLLDLVVGTLVQFEKDCILSPEETEAKWKEVFDEGVSTGKTDGNCGGVSYKEIESDWEDLKNTL